MENIGIAKMKKELERLNPQVRLDVEDYCVPAIFFGTIQVENLVLPEGYYYNDKNGITNKHRTDSGLYECFTYEYDLDHFKPQAEPKKSWFARIFAR